MPRPRNDSGEPTGRQRILDAFWSLYLETPMSRITVKDICAAARCNKTTFYYHYKNTEEVLRELEYACIPKDSPSAIIELLRQGERKIPFAVYQSLYGDKFNIFCRLLSSKGDPAFAPLVIDTMSRQWCRTIFGDTVALEDLDSHDRLLIEFTLGGTVSLFARYGDGHAIDFGIMVEVIQGILNPHFDRVLK